MPVIFRVKARDLPGRIATGAYILHAGLEKWHAEEARAKGVHQAASGAFPFLERVPPERFIKLLAAGEIAIGSALLAPVVPSVLAGAALTGFSGSLVTMYLRTPAMHKPGSVLADPGRHRGQQGRLDARHRPGPDGRLAGQRQGLSGGSGGRCSGHK